jgi:hypothetical protein
MKLSLRLLLLHAVGRILGFRFVYITRFQASDLKKRGSGRAFWSTIDPRSAATQWATTGGQHGTGTYIFTIEILVGSKATRSEASAKHKAGSPEQLDIESDIRIQSGLSTGIPSPQEAGPAPAHIVNAENPVGERAAGHRKHHAEPACEKIDLATLVSKDLD